MTCPNCQDTDHIESGPRAEGFAADLKECGLCGTTWTTRNDKTQVLQGMTHRHGLNTNECPICHSVDRVQLDIHADGFAQNLEECGVCGALWVQDRRKTRLVHGATWAA